MNDGQSPNHQPIGFAKEVWRKATHMGALIIPAGYSILSLEQSTMLVIMTPLAVLMTIIDVSRLRGWPLWGGAVRWFMNPMLRGHELDGDFSGATYILWSVVATVALFPRDIAVAALAFIVVGDTLAALIGRKFGRHRFGRKSIEGSLACLAGTMLVASVTPGLPFSISAVGATAAALTEAFSMRVDDNVSVPLVSGLTMVLFQKILAGT